jgi:hypothetical protein
MKNGKLIKTENGYAFKSEIPLDGYDMACYPWDHTKLRLSLENCEDIFKDYNVFKIDVEIEMEPYLDRNDLINDGKTHILDVQYRPKMDENNCLILKRI